MLSKEDYDELMALATVNEIMKGPSFMSRKNWKGQYERLVKNGFVDWGDPPSGFDPKSFAGTKITGAGIRAVIQTGRRIYENAE